MYKLEAGDYQLLEGEPIWLSELNLGIGREQGTYQGITREWLYWYDDQGERYLNPEERLLTAQEQLKQERQAKANAIERANRLEQLLREANINPEGNSQV